MITIVLVAMSAVLIAGAIVAYDSRKHDEHSERGSLAGAASDELQQELMRRRASGQMPHGHAH